MAAHNPEDSAGAQLAMLVATQLLLSQFRGNEAVSNALTSELERMRALLLSSQASDRKIAAFEAASESLLESLNAKD